MHSSTITVGSEHNIDSAGEVNSRAAKQGNEKTGNPPLDGCASGTSRDTAQALEASIYTKNSQGWRKVIMPSWLAVTMGTGITAIVSSSMICYTTDHGYTGSKLSSSLSHF